MEEIWKNVKGFEEKYKVSNFGSIKSLNYNNTGKEKVLIPKINKQGQLEITLNKNNKHYYRLISRLVVETFSNIKLNRNDIVMYKDNDKTNCRLDNLYIISRSQRCEITYDTGKRYRPTYKYYNEILSTKEISKKTGIPVKLIRTRLEMGWNIYEAAEVPILIRKKQ